MKRIFIIPLIFIFTGFVSGQTRVIAHRGFWDCGGSAQNSLVSLHKAHEAGCYGSEFDVIVTADGVPVIHHDDTIDSLVIEATNYDQIKDKKLKNGEILPTLEQYFIHVVNTPTSVNKFRLKTFVITLVYVFTGIEVYHKLKMDGRFYMV